LSSFYRQNGYKVKKMSANFEQIPDEIVTSRFQAVVRREIA
jgi:hypothetical protein